MKPSPAQARSPSPPSPALRARLRAQAGPVGVLSYRDFVAEALYAPGLGYYRRADRARVGRGAGTDFYTASSLRGRIFGRLVRAAAGKLIAPAPPWDYALMEIGAEPGEGVFGRDAGPFAEIVTHRLGDPLTSPERGVVFANEWLDAQPFHRFVFRRGAWRELGVRVADEDLTEVELAAISGAAQSFAESLPGAAAEEYHLDISLDAEKLLRELTAPPWPGAVILADYGYDWANLIGERPAGTARAYHRHEISRDLLDRPGEQDLTCHVCWDRLENVLRENGWADARVERQEAFFMRHAAEEIEKILAENTGAFSPARQTLMELLHPAHLGGKFQVLSARRR
jgi:SAM-dependent MidA family methyltransferase